MEVNNQVMDQMLVNAAAQTNAAQNAAKTGDGEKPDFDSMVHQKRQAEKPERKPEKADAKETAGAKTPEDEQPVSDEQYAIAAAMMFRAQPDMRYAIVQPEASEAPEAALEAAQAVESAPVEAPETELPRIPVETGTAEQSPEAVEAAREAAANDVAAAPVEVRNEAAREAAPEEKPELEPPPEVSQRAPRPEAEAPRTEETPDAPRSAGEQAPRRAEDDAEAANVREAPEAPVFDRVDAAPVKVAEVAKPIPLEAEDGVEQLGRELDGILINDASANRVEVTLTPENLGKLTVEITRGEDGTLNIVLSAANERTASLLEKSTGSLQNLLTTSARPEVQVQVRGSEETQRQFLNPDGQSDQGRQQQQRQNSRRANRQHEAQDFVQQLRLGLVGANQSEA